jgi:TonB family protein
MSLAALCFQLALLAVLASQVAPRGAGRGRHTAARHMTVTPIYFAPKPVEATPPAAAPLALAPTPPPPPLVAKPTPAPQPDARADAKDDVNSDGEEQASVEAPAMDLEHFHHQIQSAQPVFTPDPPILHGNFPDPARGKDVVLEIVISEQGTVVAAEVVQPIGYGLEEAIVQGLSQWVFIPAKVNGIAVASRQQLLFHFPG